MLRVARRLLLLIAVLTVPTLAQGTFTAATCNYADVNAVINGPTHVAVDGDTINIPAGNCTWGSNGSGDVALTSNVNITLAGAGATNTNITDNMSKGGSGCNNPPPISLILAQTDSSSSEMRITGIHIVGEAATFNCGESANHIQIGGVSSKVRVDHNTFDQGVAAIGWGGTAFGVIDHNTFNDTADKFGVSLLYFQYQGVGFWGDNSWAQPDSFGSANNLFIEDNTFNFGNTSFPVGCFDEEGGGRIVFRFNTGCPWVGMHGLDSSGRARSGRQWEVYNNAFTSLATSGAIPNMFTAIFLRGGTGFIHNNTFTDTGLAAYITLAQVNSYRSTNGIYPPWGPNDGGEGCDGNGPFDTNTGTTYASGTVSLSSTNQVMTASGSPGWTTNQWAPSGGIVYSLVDSTLGWGSMILSNTSNTITVTAPAQTGSGLNGQFNSGDSFQIKQVSACADQIGRGAGLLVRDSNDTNGTPVLNSTGLPGPVNQALDPAYEWLNSLDGTTQPTFVSNHVNIQANRDYYNWTGSFNGTSGVGTGTLAARPATCTKGVGYWATDQGNWNSSGSGGQGELFVCSATNTWTLYYTPFTYPHPLVTGNPLPTTYYVDNCVNTGSDSNDGKEQTHTTGTTGPWLTLAHVNAQTFNPGDTILFQRTCTWFEKLVPPSSGSVGLPITFSAYGTGAEPVINGSPTITSSWTLFSGNIYQTTVLSGFSSVVFEDGAYLLSETSTGAMVAGSFYRPLNGTTLYVWTVDGTSPAGHTINMAELPAGENDGLVSIVSQNYVTIDSLDIERSNWYGVYFTGAASPGPDANNIIIQNSTFHQTYQNAISPNELGTKTNNDHITVQNNTFSFCGISRPLSGQEGVAVNFLGIQTGMIQGNSVDSEYGEGLVVVGGASNVTIQKNIVTNDASAGIYVVSGFGLGGDTLNTTVQYNYVATTPDNYVIATESSGGENINGVNFLYNIGAGGPNCTYDLRFGGSGGTGVFENVLVYGNTLFGCTDAININSPSGPGNIFTNNILDARQFFALQLADTTTSNYTFNFEDVFTPFSTVIKWNGTLYTLAAFQTAFPSFFTNSFQADPLFNNSAGGNFTLQAGSPAIGKGKNLGSSFNMALQPGSSWPSSVSTIAQNPNWNIGAFESPGFVATPVIVLVSGAYINPQTTTITDSTPSATICYTIDGSVPTANGAGTCTHGLTYVGAFAVPVPGMVEAIASESGFSDSAVAVNLYRLSTVTPLSTLMAQGEIIQ